MHYIYLVQFFLIICVSTIFIAAPTSENEEDLMQDSQPNNLPLHSLRTRYFAGFSDNNPSTPSSPLQRRQNQHCEACPYWCTNGECICWKFCQTGECRKSDWGKSPVCVSTHRMSPALEEVGISAKWRERK